MSSSTAEKQGGGLDAVRDAPKTVATRMGAATQKLMEKNGFQDRMVHSSILQSNPNRSSSHHPPRLGAGAATPKTTEACCIFMLQRRAESREEPTFLKKNTHWNMKTRPANTWETTPSLRHLPSGRRHQAGVWR
ncbi:hypothetical protein PGT21_036843 [Puccinia graminis f. sp. tritici]|uniref:Uncharacterized protein n=1 Tax=Puccinia graminis f. sp. tritici TaxID=56615 RepID=A0A5B0QD25_PUCGR|nr:hypothetical protein PGT21_036843 [Puccinia graminis f. sp. tritici]